MRAVRMTLGLALASLTLLAAGCGGGGGGGGTSLSTDYKNALANANPEVAATELTRVAYAFKKAGDAASAERAANDAARKAAEIKDEAAKGMAFRDIATAQGFFGMRAESKLALKGAQAAAEKMESPDRKAEVLGQVGVVYGNYLNDADNAKYWLDEAEKAVAASTDPASKARGLIAIAYFFNKWKSDEGKAGSERLTKGAREAAGMIGKPREKIEALVEIALKIDQMKKADEAKAVFDESLVLARGISDPIQKAYALCAVAKGMAWGRKPEAAVLLDEAYKIADTAPDTSFKTEVIAQINQQKQDL